MAKAKGKGKKPKRTKVNLDAGPAPYGTKTKGPGLSTFGQRRMARAITGPRLKGKGKSRSNIGSKKYKQKLGTTKKGRVTGLSQRMRAVMRYAGGEAAKAAGGDG